MVGDTARFVDLENTLECNYYLLQLDKLRNCKWPLLLDHAKEKHIEQH